MSSELEQLKSSLTGKEVIKWNVLKNVSALYFRMPPARLAMSQYIILSQMHVPSKESCFSRQKTALVALCVVTQPGDGNVKEIVQ